MARDQAIEARLLRWAEFWKTGDGSGYPVKCTLHEDWSPPSPGMTPTMKVAPVNDAKQTHRMVSRLSERMQATLVAVYVRRMSPVEAGQELGCEAGTVGARVEAAHRELMGMLVEFCNIG
jgi:DNA-directed RNA polymerase specialized sigma24 family protein